jgi:hypothetical protein
MKILRSIVAMSIGAIVSAQDSICVKYTKAVFGSDTADNEYALIAAVVNLAVLGNATLAVPGILADEGGLAPFFNGAGPTTNRGDARVTLNFLDGAADLPNPSSSSNTYFLLTHLYQFFGALLGCTADGFPAYAGETRMRRVHRFMGITVDQNNFFIQQVGLSASALGVSSDDVTTIAGVLDGVFNKRCTPRITADDGLPSFLIGTDPSICQDPDCPVANATLCPATSPSPAPSDTPPGVVGGDTICVKYTTALFGADTAENEQALITAVVNLAVLGNATLAVPGILASEGGLARYFNGEGNTTNRGGVAVTVNFLDGAADLPNPASSSNTFILLSHLYQFFGALLGCTASGFPVYSGDNDMYRVHKFMNISLEENDFFIQQVGLSAAALGVTSEDVTTVAGVLDGVFNSQCTPLIEADDGLPAILVGTNPSICQAADCPVANASACPDDAPTQPPAGDTICVKYTIALFGDDTAENEQSLITAVVNLAVLGNATLAVPGILANEGGLARYFNGEGNTTNRGGVAVTVNFLDGAADLPNPASSSNTFILLSHLYQFFGALLGCTASGFPVYSGDNDMYRVHKFMNISLEENDFFIQQVGLSAAALGVTSEDVTTVAGVLDGVFNKQCTPLIEADDGLPAILVGTNPSICQAADCPVANASACPDTPTQPPAGDTICVKYTTAVFGADTAENEQALITAVVNLAVLGNATLAVPGILAGEGGLARYFNGAGNTTNRGGVAVAVNFLDGAIDLPSPAASSNTFILLSHLYQFFGALLGCTASGFPFYSGDNDMYRVHKFMNISLEENNFFIQQVGLSAAALGVSADDITTIAGVLDGVFNKQCTPLVEADDGLPAILLGTNPSICQAADCPVANASACPDDTTPAPATNITLAPAASPGVAADATICVKYTTALFGDDTAENEQSLITAVVNLAVLGNSTLAVPGILASEGGLARYFNGAGNTTNRGGVAVTVNFLDGAADLPNPGSSSNTFILLSHLYQFFGALLGCTASGFPAYSGDNDMYRVHKFMNISLEENNFFIQQVGLSASALGVSAEDVTTVAGVLDGVFNKRCTALVAAGDELPAILVGTNPSICQAPDCPVADAASCPAAPAPTAPTPASSALGTSPLVFVRSIVVGLGLFFVTW